MGWGDMEGMIRKGRKGGERIEGREGRKERKEEGWGGAERQELCGRMCGGSSGAVTHVPLTCAR